MKRIACLFGLHHPDKRRVRHDGQDYVAPCRGCGRQMYKTRTGNRPWELDRRSNPTPARGTYEQPRPRAEEHSR